LAGIRRSTNDKVVSETSNFPEVEDFQIGSFLGFSSLKRDLPIGENAIVRNRLLSFGNGAGKSRLEDLLRLGYYTEGECVHVGDDCGSLPFFFSS
jgi:hypothetical protein